MATTDVRISVHADEGGGGGDGRDGRDGRDGAARGVRGAAGEAADAMLALESWLRDEPELRGRVRPLRAAPRAGEMSGGLVEALAVTLATGVSAALVRSLPIWLKQRRSRVEIVLKKDSGETIRVTADNVRRGDAEELIRKALD
ncbi:effector-associated constant component EACC1 [Streptomyces sp. 6N223]|uniref:effector-associated constant component EACC1 n=1 Tax=Streptomyces sp. 6N223 TaxID=3457412 RepID=UPI003FD368E0